MKKQFKKVLVVLLAFMLTFAAACKDDTPQAAEYVVTFDAQGGSAVTSQTVEENGKATKPADPTRAGYTFTNWYTDAACTEANKYDFNTPVTSSFTLYAGWKEDAVTPPPPPPPEVKEYTVSFDSDGGSPVSNQVIEADGKVTEPENPTKTNYVFAGWYYEVDLDGLIEEVLWDFAGDTVTGDLTLKAHWTQTHYSLTFETGTDASVPGQSIEFGGQGTEPEALTKDGYTFVGWYTSAAYITRWNFDDPLDQDRVLYARWYENKTIDGDLSDWSAAELENYVVCRAQNNAKETRGWTLYAKYVKDGGLWLAGYVDHETVRAASTGDWFKQTNIEFKINGGDQQFVNTDGQTNIPEGVSKIIVTKEKAAEGNEAYANKYRSFWEVFYPEALIPKKVPGGPQRIGFAVATNGDNIAVGNRDRQVWWCNEGKDPNSSTNGYYVYDDAVGASDAISSRGIFVNANRSPVTGSITFNSNGGSPVTPASVQIGKKVTQPADPTRADYAFDGWYKDSALTAAWNFDADVVMQSYPLYAKWNPTAKYTVTFEANGAESGAPEAMTDIWVGSEIVEPEAPVKDGFIFMGWFEDNDTFEKPWIFTGNNASVVTKNITLYAKWVEIQTFNITFESNGGTAVAGTTAKTGELITKPENPTKDGYTFVGWCADEGLTTKWNFETNKVDAHITLYAMWYKNPDADLADWFGEGDAKLYQGVELRDATDSKRGVDVYARVAPEGVYIAMIMRHDNEAKTDGGAWHTSTNAEFWIGDAQHWASMNGSGEKSGNVTAMKFKTEAGTDTKWVTTFEIFVAGDFTGPVRMAFAAKPDGGGEKIKITGLTKGDGTDGWWMVSQNTFKAQTDDSIKFGALDGKASDQQFYVYADGIHLTEKV